MPTYTMRDKNTDEVFEQFMRISEYDKYMRDNPNIERYHEGAAGIVSIHGSLDSKTDNTWKEVLSKVSEAHPNSSVGKRYNRKTIKDVKTEQIIKKHVNKVLNT